VRCNKKKTEYRVDTTGFGAHYCMNVKRNHNSNHIYFTLNVDGIYQGCYSRTENHACSVQCKDFRGRKMELTESVRFALFDNETLESKRKKLERKLKTTEPRHKRRKTKMEMYGLIVEENIQQSAEDQSSMDGYTGVKQYSHSQQSHPMLKDFTLKEVKRMNFAELFKREKKEKELQVMEGIRLKKSLDKITSK